MLSTRFLALALAGALVACGTSSPTKVPDGMGVLRVQLTDAPFPFDSVKSVDIFVVRVEARLADADSADCERHLSDHDRGDWVSLAEPNRRIDLVALRGGKVADIGQRAIPPGTYRALRLIIDPSQSSVTLKNGFVLTNTSLPGVSFPRAERSGIKISLRDPVTVTEGNVATLVLDFSLDESFAIQSSSIKHFGLRFRPIIRATIKPA